MLLRILRLVGITIPEEFPLAEAVIDSELARQARYDDYIQRREEAIYISRSITPSQARRLLPTFGLWPHEISALSDEALIEAAKVNLRWEPMDNGLSWRVPTRERLEFIKALIKG